MSATCETDSAVLVKCIHCNGSGRDPIGADGYEPDEGPCYLCEGNRTITKALKDETIRVAECNSNPAAAFGAV